MKLPRHEPNYTMDALKASQMARAIEANDLEEFRENLRGVQPGELNSAVTVSGGKSLLHMAVRKQRWKFVQALLRAGADVNVRDTDRRTPLHVAAEKNNTTIINMLAEADANLEAADRSNRTAFLRACQLGKAEAAQALRNKGADIFATDMSGWGGIHLAAVSDKHTDILPVLTMMGLDINRRDDISWTPLHWVAETGSAEMALALLKEGADPFIMTDDDLDAMDMARRKSNFDTVRALQEHASLTHSHRIKQLHRSRGAPRP